MSRLLVRGAASADGDGRLVAVTPETAGWRYVGFEVVRLRAGEVVRRTLPDRELCAVLLGGRCEVRAGGERWSGVGSRASPFEGPPAAFYAPPACAVELRAVTDTDVAIGSAPARRGSPARALAPEEARLEVRGSGDMERRIHHILMEDREAEALLITEVVTPAGHWSSYPPHKHDTDDPPHESYLEETYYYRLRDPRGFALQRVYTADRSLDETIAVRDGDLVLVPRGYHTVSAAPGYEAYYLNVMAGPLREWRVRFDPDHEWLRR